MAKQAFEYFKVDPWKIEEEGFNPQRNKVSESIFSIGNEYMGVRGYMEEGVGSDTLLGSYFNGIYENGLKENETHYKGIVKKTHFMVNSVDWLYMKLIVDGVKLDINKQSIKEFKRSLDFKTGEFTRYFTLVTEDKKEIKFIFKRFISMRPPYYGYQKIEIEAVKEPAEIELETGLDYSILHWGKYNFWDVIKHEFDQQSVGTIGKTKTTNQHVFSGYQLKSNIYLKLIPFFDSKTIGHKMKFTVTKGQRVTIEKLVTNVVDKNNSTNSDHLWILGQDKLNTQPCYEDAFIENVSYWEKVWHDYDIEIIGDDKNQQGIRFCIFQLQQTYNGVDPSNNIGAKGLTGEAYSGHAFWDTETYCLPFFIFNNTDAAKNLLMYRYHTLDNARVRARELDCIGANYPIATLNGDEACDLWQHASLQFQPSTAVAYGIWHYVKNTLDKDFLFKYGLEILIEVSRFLSSRGDWNAQHNKFGFYGVMGPDEFQMMVNHNAYTNLMAKKTFEYTIKVYQELAIVDLNLFKQITEKLKINQEEIKNFETCAKAMYIPYDKNSLLYEQHEGFFDLPHIDVNQIPIEDFPLYSHWSYDRIYRNDMIKQPDVLMFMFLYNQSFSKEEKQANYDYYEPRCIHESSLSPSIHSVFAAELDKVDEAVKFFGFATRMDIDDYNRNTCEGLHTTSIAASWVNIVYGFGGFRSDGEILLLNPIIPKMWKQYSFKFKSLGNLITVIVNPNQVEIKCMGPGMELIVYGNKYQISEESLVLPMKDK